MKTALLALCASLALLGCASDGASLGSSTPKAAPIDTSRVPTGDGSSSSYTCLENPNCQ
jgi:hypothetical protein